MDVDSKDIYLNVVDICSDDVNKFKDSGTRKRLGIIISKTLDK